jgi:hypothetical protein
VFDKGQLFGLLRVAAFFQFLNHQITGGCVKPVNLIVPPSARPVAARDHFRFRPLIEIEMRDCGFDVELLHGSKSSDTSIPSSRRRIRGQVRFFKLNAESDFFKVQQIGIASHQRRDHATCGSLDSLRCFWRKEFWSAKTCPKCGAPLTVKEILEGQVAGKLA